MGGACPTVLVPPAQGPTTCGDLMLLLLLWAASGIAIMGIPASSGGTSSTARGRDQPLLLEAALPPRAVPLVEVQHVLEVSIGLGRVCCPAHGRPVGRGLGIFSHQAAQCVGGMPHKKVLAARARSPINDLIIDLIIDLLSGTQH